MRFSRASGGGPAPGFFATMAGRRLVKQAAIVAGAFVVGYLLNILVFFPGPLVEKVHAVPRVLDLGVTEARGKLEAQGLRFRIEDQRTDHTAPKGTVIWQDPPPGVVVQPNTQVSLTVSDGTTDVAVPDVAGLTRVLAERVLGAAGLKPGPVENIPAAPEAGIIVQTRPNAGTGRPVGTPVTLVVSSGPAEVSVPPVLGLSLPVARERVEVLGLKIGRITHRESPGRPEGMVLEQRPSTGSRVSRDSKVDLVVTKGT